MAADIARKLLHLNQAGELKLASKSAAFTIDAKGGDYKTLVIIKNAGNADATATFAIGNGIQGVGADLVVTVKATGDSDGKDVQAIVLDSGYFKNVSGTNKGYIKVTPSAALSFVAVELPQ